MRMPLLVEASPREAMSGPRVRLGAGRWRITSRNWVASKLGITVHNLDNPSVIPLDLHHELDGPAIVSISILGAGPERSLTLFAELI